MTNATRDFERAHHHLHELVELGNSLEEIATHAGVSRSTLGRIYASPTPHRQGESPRVVKVVETVLALPLGAIGAHELAEPSIRRVRALAAIGHGQETIAAAAGIIRDTVGELQHAEWRRIKRTDAAKIRAAYEHLRATPGRSQRIVRMAEQRGWPPPQAWSAQDLDDPDPTVTARVTKQWAKTPKARTCGQSLRDARLANDYTAEELAAKIGVAKSTLRNWEGDRYRPTAKHHPVLLEVLGWTPPPE